MKLKDLVNVLKKICLCELFFSRVTEQPSLQLSGCSKRCRQGWNSRMGQELGIGGRRGKDRENKNLEIS